MTPLHQDDAESEALRARLSYLEHGLRLIVSEARQFPDEDGIGAGSMATNLLRLAPEADHVHEWVPDPLSKSMLPAYKCACGARR